MQLLLWGAKLRTVYAELKAFQSINNCVLRNNIQLLTCFRTVHVYASICPTALSRLLPSTAVLDDCRTQIIHVKSEKKLPKLHYGLRFHLQPRWRRIATGTCLMTTSFAALLDNIHMLTFDHYDVQRYIKGPLSHRVSPPNKSGRHAKRYLQLEHQK